MYCLGNIETISHVNLVIAVFLFQEQNIYIARNEQFLLFQQCFLFNQKIVSPFANIFDITSLFAAELEEPKICILGQGLTLYQTAYTKFGLNQINGICRWKFRHG